jgi:hypothetical protein
VFFQGGGSCHIMICDAAKYFSQYNGGCLPNKGTDINHLFTKIQNFYDDLLKNILVSEILIRTNFDKIVNILSKNTEKWMELFNNCLKVLNDKTQEITFLNDGYDSDKTNETGSLTGSDESPLNSGKE